MVGATLGSQIPAGIKPFNYKLNSPLWWASCVIVYSEAILGDYGPEAQTQVTPNSMFQCASNFKGFLLCYKIKKVINQVKFKIYWLIPQRGSYNEMG